MKTSNQEQQTENDKAIFAAIKSAEGSVTTSLLCEKTSLKPVTARASIKRLLVGGKIFTAGNKRSARYGSTQNKANVSPFGTATA